jgi:MtfA peptidase
MIIGIALCMGFLCYTLVYALNGVADKKIRHWELSKAAPRPVVNKGDIICHAPNNQISFEETHDILIKHSHYFKALEPGLKQKFIERILLFMDKKTFIIKDDEAFKEMPVLVSAAAIQLTLGLKDYLLPFYKYIRIFPEEYLADHSFRILAGNVENNTITVAWNHLLQGNANATDGSNLGLHEMSHALYFQKLIIDADQAKRFVKKYNHLITECREAWQTESTGRKNLYSSYAESDIQEFWAESVELFFEKPLELQLHYPNVYGAMKLVLNQDPANQAFPIIKPGLTFRERLFILLGYDKAQT